jgi:hypothetical protein
MEGAVKHFGPCICRQCELELHEAAAPPPPARGGLRAAAQAILDDLDWVADLIESGPADRMLTVRVKHLRALRAALCGEGGGGQ